MVAAYIKSGWPIKVKEKVKVVDLE